MKMLTCICTLLSLLCCITSIAASEGFRYPVSGSKQVIVYPQNAEEREVKAAKTLAYYLGKITGVEPACVKESAGTTIGGSIFIGDTKAGIKAIPGQGNLPEDGYRIRTLGGAIYLRGASPAGTQNAVAGLLLDYLGVFWGGPGPMWQSIPRQNVISLPKLNIRSCPAYAYRTCSGIADLKKPGSPELSFNQAMRVSQGSYGFDHNLFRIISDSQYGKTHPEYFALMDGKRITTSGAQPCFSNPDVFRIVVDTIHKAFDEDPTRKTYSLCANDNALFCECDKCAAMDAPARMWRGAKDYSGSYYDFLNRVAEEILKTHPDKQILAYAYWGTILPPRQIDRFPRNVHITVTQDVPQQFDSKYRKEDIDMLTDWAKKSPNISVMVYWNLGWITPRYCPHVAGDYLRTAWKLGSQRIYCDTNPNWIFQAPMVYSMSRQLWDTNLSTDALIAQYMKAMFKDQAEPMGRFYDLMEEYWSKGPEGNWFGGFGNWDAEAYFANAPIMEQAVSILQQAYKDTKDQEVSARLKWMLDKIRLPQLLVQNEAAMRTWSDAPNTLDLLNDASAQKEVESMLERDREIVKIAPDLFEKDEMYPGYYRGTIFWHKITAALQNTQYALAAGTVQNLTAQARKTGSIGDIEAVRAQLQNFKAPDITGKYDKPVVPAADMITMIEASKMTPRIDGDLSEWSNLQFQEIKYVPGPEWGTWKNPPSMAVAWDDENLYLALRVPDTKHVQTHSDAGIWQEDSIQIAIDPLCDGYKQKGFFGHYDPDDVELGFALSGTDVVGWSYTGEKPRKLNGWPVSITRQGEDTLYEVAMPWKELTGSDKHPGDLIGFNVVVNGSDGDRRAACGWTDGITTKKDPRVLGHIWLKP